MNKKGFVLFETLIYTVLVALLFSSSLAACFALIDAARETTQKSIIAEEAFFIISKYKWLLSNAKIIIPTQGTSANRIVVSKDNEESEQTLLEIYAQSGRLFLKRENLPTSTLSNNALHVSDITFNHQNQGEIIVTFLINGAKFGSTFFADF